MTDPELIEKFIAASRLIADQLEPHVSLMWHKELIQFHESNVRGDEFQLSPLALAIRGVVWEHITANEPLFFPPELAAHYSRAHRANLN